VRLSFFGVFKRVESLTASLCSADPFSKKDWYDVKAPGLFKNPYVGKTFVNQTQGKGTRFLVAITFSLSILLPRFGSVAVMMSRYD